MWSGHLYMVFNYYSMKTSFLSIALLAAVTCFAQKLPKKIILPEELNEVSGLYWAAPDSLWWHNDSGDAPRLFLTDRSGAIKNIVYLPQIRNRDWEDITADHQGNIYIGDFGNNANKRRDLCIYKYNSKQNKLDSIIFEYPDQTEFPPPDGQENFNMEAFFWYQDSLHLFSKNSLGKASNFCTKHYMLPAQPGKHTPLLQDSIRFRNRVVTAAAVSPDGHTVALLAYNYKKLLGFIPVSATSIFLFQDFEDGHFFDGTLIKKNISVFTLATQYESLDFVDDNTIYIASEKTKFIRAKAKKVSLKRK